MPISGVGGTPSLPPNSGQDPLQLIAQWVNYLNQKLGQGSPQDIIKGLSELQKALQDNLGSFPPKVQSQLKTAISTLKDMENNIQSQGSLSPNDRMQISDELAKISDILLFY